MSGANQSYPQTVSLDAAKAKAADMQSNTSKAQDGNINPSDPASKARVRFLAPDPVQRDLGLMRAQCIHILS